MVRENDRATCVLCGGHCESVTQLAEGKFPISVFRCEKCGNYGLSYTLWFRLKLSGWNVPALTEIKSHLQDAKNGANGKGGKPLVIMRAEAKDAALVEKCDEWDLLIVE